MLGRLAIFRRLLLIGLALLVLRLAQLQLLQGADYRQQAEQNRLRVIPQRAPRGMLLDRDGRKLATNHVIFRVAAIPQDLPKKASSSKRSTAISRRAVFERLGDLLHLSADELEARFDEHVTMPFLPAELVNPIPKAVALRIEEERVAMPGIVVESLVTRRYPMGSVASQLIGYLSQPDAEVFSALKPYGVRPQDLIGRAGLERELDAYLRGRPGGALIEVNHRARQVRVLGNRQRAAGETVTLTIDAQLQQLIEQQFQGHPGACVVLQPFTGEVLAMVSIPGFDPQAFADQDSAAIQADLEDPYSPLMNRAAVGTYLPGSIIKLATGAIALEHGVITRNTVITCPGYVEFGDRRIHCWNRDGHGPVHLREALMGSCNVFFMEVGRRLGLERLRAGYQAIGFGRRTGWLLEESMGHLPTRRLSEGEVAMLAMGQGQVLITPLQAAVMASVFANDGWIVEPWVVARVGDHAMHHTHLMPTGWSAETIAAIREGMDAVVNDPHGTGIRAHSPNVHIVGKTGTAQTQLQGLPHGWFVGFCPEDAPQAAIAIVAEHGGSGGDLPASIGRTICEYIAIAGRPAEEEPLREADVATP